METSGLYTLVAKFAVDALSVLTVSDSLLTGESSTAEQRERDFPMMTKIALEISPYFIAAINLSIPARIRVQHRWEFNLLSPFTST